MDYEQEFKRSLEAAGIPTTEEKLKTEWQNIADEANLPIANPSKFSAFWVFVTNAVTSPAKWLIQHMYQTVMPNMYVKTASGSFLDLLGWAYDVERKSAVKARGMMTFSRKKHGAGNPYPGRIMRSDNPDQRHDLPHVYG